MAADLASVEKEDGAGNRLDDVINARVQLEEREPSCANAPNSTQEAAIGELGATERLQNVSLTYPANEAPSFEEKAQNAPENTQCATDSRGEDAEVEFQNIMEQFDRGKDNAAGHMLTFENKELSDEASIEMSTSNKEAQRPPRTSSLELVEPTSTYASEPNLSQTEEFVASSEGNTLQGGKRRVGSIHRLDYSQVPRFSGIEASSPKSPLSSPSLHKALPPAPEPELPFDFHRFLDQLRHRTADPVAKYLRSFLLEFGKKQWMVHEQVKIISDFLTFITGKMAQCEVWQGVSDAEFDNAREGMEKLVMNRLYSQTFSPAIPAHASANTLNDKKRGEERRTEPGRRGQHQEDIERDAVLAQKVRIYKWIREEHLDIAPVDDSGKRFLLLAQQELVKIKSYRAPRDKVICILNSCKVIFGLLRNTKASDTSADSFMPLLIYVILQANPENLVSNAQYILRFRNQDKLGGEAGYYVSSLMGAIQFIENLDRTSLTISDEDFERNVEVAVSAIAERNSQDVGRQEKQFKTHSYADHSNSQDQEGSRGPDPTHSRQESEIMEKDAAEHVANEKAAVSGLLRSIQKPLSNIGRIFSDEPSGQYPANQRQQQTSTAPPETPRRLSPALFQPPRSSQDNEDAGSVTRPPRSPRLSAEDAAARQASAEVAEAQRIQRAEHKDIVETLAGMFPTLDKDVIDDVVRQKEGRVGSAVDACLALNTDT